MTASAAAQRDDVGLLLESLESLSLPGKEPMLVERFFDLFFERHPEVRELFGEHGVNEKEEMIRETLASVFAWAEDEPWLDGNLEAMGRSHAEYGVEDAMYDAFVDTMLDALEEVAGPDWKDGCREAWRAALERITGAMRRAGARVS
jgi:hemoglobin-like flavoprotein